MKEIATAKGHLAKNKMKNLKPLANLKIVP
jgi:hypothetical protein